MKENERKRKNVEHLADLIANSFSEELCDLKAALDVNSYGASMGFTYPDSHHNYYTPGMIHHLKVGVGPYVTTEYDPNFVDKCFQLDNIVLKRLYRRVNFKDIRDDDMVYYIGIADFTSLPDKSDHHLHFIWRTPSGLWLHKPSWVESIQLINWTDYGKTFHFCIDSKLVSPAQKPLRSTCDGTCFQEFFYAIELM